MLSTYNQDTACGAHKPTHYDFLDGTVIEIKSAKKAKDSEEESEEDFD